MTLIWTAFYTFTNLATLLWIIQQYELNITKDGRKIIRLFRGKYFIALEKLSILLVSE
jgi:hypothetical protein